jgi:LysR family glycine cleavage system transcriptional activator
MRLPLNTLPAFREVALKLNLRAAAETLNLTHCAVSQQIRVLEEQLGFPVFERRGRRVVLNPAGEVLLKSVQAALAQLDDGMQTAAATAAGNAHQLRVTVLPSFAQRWLLPRMGRWHAKHPNVSLEIDASQQLVDLPREGFHAALRTGQGPWPGLETVRLFESPMPIIVVASPTFARRLEGQGPEAFAREPLLGEAGPWHQWFTKAGVRARVRPVAIFNDFGMMLQAAEQSLGLALVRELLAADALADGRLVRMSPLTVTSEAAQTYHLAFPIALRDWPPLIAFQQWLRDEFEMSRRMLHPDAEPAAADRARKRASRQEGTTTSAAVPAPLRRRRQRDSQT